MVCLNNIMHKSSDASPLTRHIGHGGGLVSAQHAQKISSNRIHLYNNNILKGIYKIKYYIQHTTTKGPLQGSREHNSYIHTQSRSHSQPTTQVILTLTISNSKSKYVSFQEQKTIIKTKRRPGSQPMVGRRKRNKQAPQLKHPKIRSENSKAKNTVLRIIGY